ncbi:potassium channel family protein [Porcipelethomonas sp.]|uniref:potassium channel family protein n=1 Tax=Porcipelethomonas sp. TaxID=2981675 RepID=UPI003EF28F96
MKSVLIIGLGRFGMHLIRKFYELGDDVMAVDIDEAKVQEAMPYATSAQIGDCTKTEMLKNLGVNNFDVCFVCIGQCFQSSLEITNLLHEMGAKKVISKANTEIHAKFLLRNGADEVTFPERDSAYKLAVRYSADNIFDFIELSKDTAIYEIPVLDSWIGKSILKVDARKKYHINILAIKNNDVIKGLPSAEYIFNDNDHIVVLGHNSDVEKLLKKMD